MALIDRDALKRHYAWWGNTEQRKLFDNIADAQKPVDAVPVVHGHWEDNGIEGSMLSKCSSCGFRCGAYTFNFCPNCGAKMDGKEQA